MAATTQMTAILGYWNIRGLAAPCRLLFEFAGVDWEERQYVAKMREDGKADASDWTDEKFNLNLAFPNLPYLLHGDVKITQSTAIWLYLAELGGIQGSTPEQRARANSLLGVSNDLRSKRRHETPPARLLPSAIIRYTRLSYDSEANFAVLRDEFVEGSLSTTLADLETVVRKSGGPYLLGDELTYVDLIWWDLLDQFRLLAPTLLPQFPLLVAFCAKVEALPKVAALRASSKWVERPLNNVMAAFKKFINNSWYVVQEVSRCTAA